MPKQTLSFTLALLLTLLLLTACGGASGLKPDDFNLYLNGVAVVKVDDEIAFFADADDGPYTSKRGITFGDTAEDIAETYKNSPVHVVDMDISEQEIRQRYENTKGDSLTQYLNQYPALQNAAINYTLIKINGIWTTDRDKLTGAKEDADTYWCTLSFIMSEGKVDEIGVYTNAVT